jgi:hypothetical protein
MTSNSDLDARVARLEREGRVWRAAAVLSMLFAVGAWIVPAASAQTQAPFVADTIFARQIFVVPNVLAPNSGSAIRLTVDGNGAALSVQGSEASLIVAGLDSRGPAVNTMADAQSARVWTFDASHASASMGWLPDAPGAFRAYDNIANPDPVWAAP